MSENGNGKVTELGSHGLSIDEKLDLVIEGLKDLSDRLDMMDEKFEEKFNNLSLPGSGYDIFQEN